MTYGTLRLETIRTASRGVLAHWVIQAEAFLLLRLRRIFPRVTEKAGAIRIKSTPEVCTDLRWVLDRWPLDIRPEDLELLEQGAAQHAARVARASDLLTGRAPPQPIATAIPLREYQAVAVDLAVSAGGLLVGDELGVGKTAIGIGVIATHRPAVVVTLTHLPRQWASEIERFLPGTRTFIPRKAAPYDVTVRGTGKPWRAPTAEELDTTWPEVWIIPYSKLAGWADTLRELGIRSVIFDEAHELRNGTGEKVSAKWWSACVLTANAEVSVGLTGTPVFNYGADVWSILRVLRPDALGELSEFRREWCSNEDRVRDPAAFGAYLRSESLYLRRTRQDVGRELPELVVVPVEVDADPAPLKAERSVAAELARRILARTDLEQGEGFRLRGELDWRLRQATGLAKATAVVAFVQVLVEQGESVLLYGWHRAVYDLWTSEFNRLGTTYALFTGSETQAQKAESIEAFMSGRASVLVMSLRAGAGIDGMQHGRCRVIVHGELDWSPAVHKQGVGRLHRDGQGKPVTNYVLHANTGSDPIVLDVLGVKRQQAVGIEDPDGSDLAPVLDGDRVLDLARAYLASIGEAVPEAAAESVSVVARADEVAYATGVEDR